MTLLAISNLVTISEKNTTKDNQKKSRLTKDDEKKRFLCANIDFFVLWLSFELLNETIYISIFSL